GAVGGVVRLNPREAVAAKVALVEGGVVPRHAVEIADEPADAVVPLVLGQIPVELTVVVPLLPLGEFAPHEQQRFAGRGVLVAEQQPQVGELLHSSPGIWLMSEPLPCTTSSCE